MRRTLIIGLGGTGVKVGHVIKRRINEFFSREELIGDGDQLVQFLFIENDWNEVDRAARFAGAGGVRLQDFVVLPGPNARAYQERAARLKGQKGLLKEDSDLLAWFDQDVIFPAGTSAIGMAANRQLGRLALYQRFNEVTAAVQDKIDRLKKAAPNQPVDGNNVAIYVISSICGGTGSSTFLDVAGIVDLATERGIDKRAVLLLPSEFLRLLQGRNASDETFARYLANSWAFMQECEYFKKYERADRALMHRFLSRPSGLANKAAAATSFQPFTVAYLFENQTSDEHSIQGDDLYRFMGDSIFEMICGSANDQVASFLINRDPNTEKFDDHRTIAYLTLEFPNAEYEEYFQSRFLYEYATSYLYKVELTGSDMKAIETAAVALRDQLRGEVLPGAIAAVTVDIDEASERTELLRIADDGRAYGDPGGKKVKTDSELDQLFDVHNRMIAAFEARAESLADRQKLRYCNFQQLFSGDNEPVDRLRSAVWATAADTVRQCGYLGLIGDGGAEPGLLPRLSSAVLEWLGEMRARLHEIRDALEVLRGDLERARMSLKKHAAGRLGRKAPKDVTADTNAIGGLLSRIVELTTERAVLRLETAIVSAFAEVTHQNPRPWLNLYLSQTRNAVEAVVSKWAADKEPDSGSLAAKYLHGLRQKFQNAEKDVFRWCIPYALHEAASSQGWKPDAENPLGGRFSSNVNLNAALAAEVLRDDTPLGQTTMDVSRIGEEQDAIKDKLARIERRISTSFRTRFLEADGPLADFLSMSVLDAWEMLSKTSKGKEIQKGFLARTRNPPFALPMTLGGDQANDRMRFASVFGEPSFVGFAETTLGVQKAQVVQHHKPSLRTRLSYLQIISRVKFADILTTGQCRTAYSTRDVRMVRPHVYRDWNNQVEGPWAEQFEIKETYASVKVGNVEYSITLEEAFLLCLIMDGLRRCDKEIKNTMFVTDRTQLTREHLVGSTPIAIDRDQVPPSYSYATECRIDEGSAKPAGRKGARTLRFAIPESKLTAFRFSPTALNFGDAFNDLQSAGAGFEEAVRGFLRVAVSHRPLIRKRLGDRRAATSAASNLTGIAESLRAIRHTGTPIGASDAQFAEEVFTRSGALMRRLFGQGL